MKPVLFALLSILFAFGVNEAVTYVPYLGPTWSGIYGALLFLFLLVGPAAGIAALAWAMGFWRASRAVATYALIVCVIVPPTAIGLSFAYDLWVRHARML